jgi:hypothetical protein
MVPPPTCGFKQPGYRASGYGTQPLQYSSAGVANDALDADTHVVAFGP